MEKDINLNSLEKNSFYSFLSLYIISSTLFIFLSAYWYYEAQYSSLEQNEYYRLQHISDAISQKIINAHMMKKKLVMPAYDNDITVALISTKDKVVYGKLMDDYIVHRSEYITNNGNNILSSDAPQGHLNIKYVVLHSDRLSLKIIQLKQNVIATIVISILIVIILAWLLSMIFIKPLRQRVKQVEDFVHDTTHELNTPITALSMSVSFAMKQEECKSNKFLKNISISTKQLFDIYNALSYLSFDSNQEEPEILEISKVVEKSVAYYKELAHSKGIIIESTHEEFFYAIDEAKLTMLFGNLINNAIKYSHPNSKIIVSFSNAVFKVQDFGIGIKADKLENIYDRFNRETECAGGFGIGLSIVKKIVQEYNLDIKVKSKLGEGSSFLVLFDT